MAAKSKSTLTKVKDLHQTSVHGPPLPLISDQLMHSRRIRVFNGHQRILFRLKRIQAAVISDIIKRDAYYSNISLEKIIKSLYCICDK